MRSIREVLHYKNDAEIENNRMPNTLLAQEFQPLGLSDMEIESITAFLSNSLRDEQLARYLPERLPSGNCFPFADSQSKIDLGCQ
jgi:cytochrome c peroxidase